MAHKTMLYTDCYSRIMLHMVETPVGIIDSITVHKIVKQGIIFGTKLVSVATEI